MQIAVIGTGYVGLVTGVCLSEFGFRVTCVDRDGDHLIRTSQGLSDTLDWSNPNGLDTAGGVVSTAMSGVSGRSSNAFTVGMPSISP